MSSGQPRSPNRILSNLTSVDFALLRPFLVQVQLPLRKVLESKRKFIDHVYFIEHGLASVVANAGTHHSIEVGVIGPEGMTGLAVVMATDVSAHEIFMQSPGSGLRIRSASLAQAINDSRSLRDALLRYGHTMSIQMAYTALANGRYKINERLARWLLMAQDRSDTAAIALTHEFLAVMLGCRRPGVTTALSALAKDGLIKVQRGAISVLDRSALEEAANGSYGAPEMEYRRLFPQVFSSQSIVPSPTFG